MSRFLRNKKDGFIYDWNPILADNVLVEEVTEEEAYPELFIPKLQKGRKSKLELDSDIPEAPTGNPDLGQDASKGL